MKRLTSYPLPEITNTGSFTSQDGTASQPGTARHMSDIMGCNSSRSHTPRNPDFILEPTSAPTSPGYVKRTRARAPFHDRTDSLRDTKVSFFPTDNLIRQMWSFFNLSTDTPLLQLQLLLVTGMRRSDSTMQPDLFQYHEHFIFQGLAGKTATSEVFRVLHRLNGETFAVKRSRRRFRSKVQREQCLREIRAVAALPPHASIVGQHRAWQEAGHFYIQMDYCPGGSLQQLLKQKLAAHSTFTDNELWKVFIEVATGLDFLHLNSVLHLDIKPDNIYLDAGGHCRIGDFGLAITRGTDSMNDWQEGDGDYLAPELLGSSAQPTAAADIFSFGCTMYECATGQKIDRMKLAQCDRVALPGRPAIMEEIVSQMVSGEASARPSASELVQHVLTLGIELELSQRLKSAATAALSPSSSIGNLTIRCPLTDASNRVSPFDCSVSPRALETTKNTGANMVPQLAVNVKPEDNGKMKWMPNLSPLISEGKLTPPIIVGSDKEEHCETTKEIEDRAPVAGSPLGKRRPPRLLLPPFFPQQHPPSTHRTQESFRLCKRDLAMPPDSDDGSASESEEPYSYSCGSGRTYSDMDFADILSPHSMTATAPPVAPAPTPETSSTGDLQLSARLPPLSWDILHMSPEFLMQLPPGSPRSPSKVETPQDGIQSSRSLPSVRRFPTLDSMGSMQPESARKPDTIITMAAQKLTCRVDTMPGMPPTVPPLSLPTESGMPVRRKRQHSSRRALVSALSGEGPLASSRSIDGLMPLTSKARLYSARGDLKSMGDHSGNHNKPSLTARGECPGGTAAEFVSMMSLDDAL